MAGSDYGTAFSISNQNPFMQNNRINPQPENSENVEKNELINENEERFESDTQKIVRQHLQDRDHIITDEDIANVRVGMVPREFNATTEESRKEEEKKFIDDTNDLEEDKNLEDEKITPWDIIDPTR